MQSFSPLHFLKNMSNIDFEILQAKNFFPTWWQIGVDRSIFLACINRHYCPANQLFQVWAKIYAMPEIQVLG